MRSTPALENEVLSGFDFNNVNRFFANCSIFFSGDNSPVTPCSTPSLTPPVSNPTTGVHIACDSKQTIDIPSSLPLSIFTLGKQVSQAEDINAFT